MKTKLVQLTTDPNVGGGPKYVKAILAQTNEKEFDSFLIAPRGWLSSEVKGQVLTFEMTNLAGLSEKAAQLRSILIKIKQSGYPFAPVILHAHTPQAAYLADKATRGLGVYLIYTEHLWTLDYHLQSKLREFSQLFALKQSLRSVSKVIAVSTAVRKFLEKRHIAAKDKIEVIYPVLVEGPKIKNKKSADKSHLPIASSLRLGTVGALNTVKGYNYLLEAVNVLRQEMPNIRLEIIGDGPELESLKSQVQSLKLNQVVKIITNAKELDKYYDNWDIYLQPSLSETFGLAVFEAMRRGIPVVATKVGGLPELIEDGESGLLVPVADSAKLASALTKLASSKELRQKLGRGAASKAKDEVSDPKINIGKIFKIYQELINNSQVK